MQNPEREPLIEGEEKSRTFTTKPSRTVIVEPLVALTAVGVTPLVQLTQEFIYARIFNQLADEHGVNVSAGATDTQSNCLQTNSSSLNTTQYDPTKDAQAAAATYTIFLELVLILPVCISISPLTAFSDAMGRKYAIIPPVVGLACYSFTNLITVLCELPLWCLLVGGFINGLCGDYLTVMAACSAYISDITTVSNRSYRLTLLTASAFTLRIPMAPLLGYLVKKVGFLIPFLCVFILQIIGLLYAIFLVPETIAFPRPTRIFTLSHFKSTLHVFLMKREPKGQRGLLCMLVFVGILGSSLIGSTLLLYTLFQLNRPLCWSTGLVGIFLAVYMMVGGLGQALVARVLKRCFSELVMCLLGACCLILQNVLTGLAETTTMMFLATLFAPVAALIIPLTRSMMSGLVGPDEQGKLFGAIGLVERIGIIVASTVMNLIYANTLGFSSGFVFFVVAALAAVDGIILLYMAAVSKRTYQYSQVSSSEEHARENTPEQPSTVNEESDVEETYK